MYMIMEGCGTYKNAIFRVVITVDNELPCSCSLDKDKELRGDNHMGWDYLTPIAAVGYPWARFPRMSGDREVGLVEFQAV
jgi:hypothetical protein